MEKDLEHRIKDAYQKNDENTNYPQKHELWSRIENANGKKKKVLAYWRVAAIFLAFFMVSGVFAGIILNRNNLRQRELLQNEIHNLNNTVDSLQNIPPKVIAEIEYREKEIPVFVPVENKVNNSSEIKQNEVLKLENDALNKQLTLEKKLFQAKIDSLHYELLVLRESKNENVKSEKEENVDSNLFELKSENYDTLYQQKPKTGNPKIKLQLLRIQDNIKYDTNPTLLKK